MDSTELTRVLIELQRVARVRSMYTDESIESNDLFFLENKLKLLIAIAESVISTASPTRIIQKIFNERLERVKEFYVWVQNQISKTGIQKLTLIELK